METNQNESVTQADVSGATTEETKQVTQQPDDRDRYKRDMLRFKDESTALKERIRELELAEEQKKGNLEGVITSLKDQLKEEKNKNKLDRYNFSKTNLDSAIKQEALSKGLSSEKAEVFMKLISDDDKGAVSLDETFRPDMDDVRGLVDKNMERYSSIGLFGKNVKVVDATPNSTPNTQPKKAKKIEDMSWDEAVAYAKTLKD